MRYYILIIIALLFASCSSSSIAGYGLIGVIGIFALMFILFAVMFFLIAKRKKQGEKSLVKFNNDVYIALSKLSTPEQKINMLNNLIERIKQDEKYKKDTDWQNKVLVKTYMHLATVYYQSGNEGETLNICSEIIRLDPKDGMAYYNRGSIYSNMGLYEKALQDLNQTIELLPDYASAYNNRGLVHEKMEHYDKALADFNTAIELENSPIALFNRGNTKYELKDYRGAIKDYEQAKENTDATNADLIHDLEISIKAAKEKVANE